MDLYEFVNDKPISSTDYSGQYPDPTEVSGGGLIGGSFGPGKKGTHVWIVEPTIGLYLQGSDMPNIWGNLNPGVVAWWKPGERCLVIRPMPPGGPGPPHEKEVPEVPESPPMILRNPPPPTGTLPASTIYDNPPIGWTRHRILR